MEEYILTIDEGTSSVRAILFNNSGKPVAMEQIEIKSYHPHPGWVEQDPEEIWNKTQIVVRGVIEKSGVDVKEIKAVGITNQRETTVMWDKKGHLYNAIVWQCRRTSHLAEKYRKEYGEIIKEKTGLVVDSYFSALKIKWLIDNVEKIKEKIQEGKVFFGTIDSFLIYKFTKNHFTDVSNASRTMLFNIKKMDWDDELAEIFGIPMDILPEVKNSSDDFGFIDIGGREIPIYGVAGDQQAALFGEVCFEKGDVKVTYGTGNFIMMNTGDDIKNSENLITTVGWKINGKTAYAVEGSIFVTGAAIKYLRDVLKIIESAEETEEMAYKISSNDGVYFVPAFVGLGAPYWDEYARGLLIGITSATKREHIVRAALESIAYLTRDVLDEMEKIWDVREIKADGGAARNDFLMQFQADITNKRVIRGKINETTSLGVAFLAGLRAGMWGSEDEIRKIWDVERIFEPRMNEEERNKLYSSWKEAVRRASGWAKVIG